MKTTDFIKKELPMWIIILAPIVYMITIWNELPEKLPMHWNIKGEIDNYGSKWILPLLNAGLYLLLLFLPFIDPNKNNFKKFGVTYYIIRIVLITFFSTVQFITALAGKGTEVNTNRFIVTGMLLLFTILGNYMGNIKKNWFVGIRTPWTLSNEEVWRKTHFLAGKLWFWFCLAGLTVSFFLSDKSLFIFFAILISTISLVPVVYSYIVFKHIKINE